MIMDDTSSDESCMDYHNVVDMCSWQFILKALILTLITIAIILGNSLVITAVFLYQKLRKSVSNSFIASLAVADLMLGLIVLPFSVIIEVMGYWLFGEILCKIWLVVDVWVCTSSILHLCAISFDRYIAIAYPLRYPNLMTQRRCRLICVAMWVLSFIICFPSLVDWGSGTQSDGGAISNATELMNTTAGPPLCNVVSGNSIGYIIYSAMGSFFIPCVIMSALYIKIFLLARKFMMQSKSGAITGTHNGSGLRVHRGYNAKVGGRENLTYSTSNYEKHRLTNPNCGETNTDNNNDSPDSDEEKSFRVEKEQTSRESSVKSRLTIDRQALTNVFTRRTSKPTLGHSMNKETRAAKTLAIIVGCFILCWCPFFIMYVTQGITGITINKHVWNFFFWVGYCNSLLNPCIYAFFSNDYRHAFKKILKCQVKSAVSRRQGMMRYMASLYVSSSSGSKRYDHNVITAVRLQQTILPPPMFRDQD